MERGMRSWGAIALLLTVVACSSACGSDDEGDGGQAGMGASCVPGIQLPCMCSDGVTQGVQVCDATGLSVGWCNCGPGSGGVGAGGAGNAGAGGTASPMVNAGAGAVGGMMSTAGTPATGGAGATGGAAGDVATRAAAPAPKRARWRRLRAISRAT